MVIGWKVTKPGMQSVSQSTVQPHAIHRTQFLRVQRIPSLLACYLWCCCTVIVTMSWAVFADKSIIQSRVLLGLPHSKFVVAFHVDVSSLYWTWPAVHWLNGNSKFDVKIEYCFVLSFFLINLLKCAEWNGEITSKTGLNEEIFKNDVFTLKIHFSLQEKSGPNYSPSPSYHGFLINYEMQRHKDPLRVIQRKLIHSSPKLMEG